MRRWSGKSGADLAARLGRWLDERRERRRLAGSGGFDPVYYLDRYPDVAAAGIDPLLHYLRHGAGEGRLPHAAAALGAEEAALLARVGPIDVVFTWVDGDDPAHRRGLADAVAAHCSCFGAPPDPRSIGGQRFHDHGWFRYALRSVAACVPWARRIHIVTNGQCPRWLDPTHPRLALVTHGRIFDDPAMLPTFNSNAIEAFLHRIPGLSRYFLSLNDDMFFARPARLADFFGPGGGLKVRFSPGGLNRDPDHAHPQARSVAHTHALLDHRFGIKVRRQGFPHAPVMYDRDRLDEIERSWPLALRRTRSHRLRNERDVVLHPLFLHVLAETYECASHDPETAALIETLSARDAVYLPVGLPGFQVAPALEAVVRDEARSFCLNDVIGEVGEPDPAQLGPELERVTAFLARLFPEPAPWETDRPAPAPAPASVAPPSLPGAGRRAFVVGPYAPTGAARLRDQVARLLAEELGFAVTAVGEDRSGGGIFDYPRRFPSIGFDALEEAIGPDDLLVADAAVSHLQLGLRCRGTKVMLVQDFTGFRLLDCCFDHYVCTSRFLRDVLDHTYGVTAEVIPPFLDHDVLPPVRPWRDRPAGSMVVVMGGVELGHRHLLLDRLRRGVAGAAPGLDWDDVVTDVVPQRALLERIGAARYCLPLAPADGFGRLRLETLALGTVLFGFDGFGGRDFLRPGRNCQVVPYPDFEPLITGMIAVAGDDLRAEALAAAGRETAADPTYTEACFRARWRRWLGDRLGAGGRAGA